ncbi:MULTISPECIES: DNA polymerase [unclassified Duganella]|uniref:DNA polymerase n=1 Tax=unclassified Duganella TaxID=2636909 RepID=UPI00088B20BF|nr:MULTISPECIES: DNA polymerase [unclassified Duganella]SDG60573.1 DNA polymerase family A [Duganella sp. OV458]SDJ84041.1 DNA polymerase family A [Duganella sp. OV510]
MKKTEFRQNIWVVASEISETIHSPISPRFEAITVINVQTSELIEVSASDVRVLTKFPIPLDGTCLLICYDCVKFLNAMRAEGWPLPEHLIDLRSEFLCITNGSDRHFGTGLNGAMLSCGLPATFNEPLSDWPGCTNNNAFEPSAESVTLSCKKKAIGCAALFDFLHKYIEFDFALLRGMYSIAASAIENNGVPLDHELLELVATHWDEIKQRLIDDIDAAYSVFRDGKFDSQLWAAWLKTHGIAWPTSVDGLDLSDASFKSMAKLHPDIAPVRWLKTCVESGSPDGIAIHRDGRSRAPLATFSSSTSRNQPSTKRSVFGRASWTRGFVRPTPGYGIAYIDWAQQEFGIAASLSSDLRMQEAYCSGDPYLKFGIQSGILPTHATRDTHPGQRELFKQSVLAIQYGIGAESLAEQTGQTVSAAVQMLQLHRNLYSTFWAWSDEIVTEALLGGKIWTAFGWYLHTNAKSNERSLRNFPMQANGAEMLRLACIQLVDSGVRVCATMHDALLIEAPIATLQHEIAMTQKIMAQASKDVLGGFEIQTSVQTCVYPNRFTNTRNSEMWNKVMAAVGQLQSTQKFREVA